MPINYGTGRPFDSAGILFFFSSSLFFWFIHPLFFFAMAPSPIGTRPTVA